MKEHITEKAANGPPWPKPRSFTVTECQQWESEGRVVLRDVVQVKNSPFTTLKSDDTDLPTAHIKLPSTLLQPWLEPEGNDLGEEASPFHPHPS